MLMLSRSAKATLYRLINRSRITKMSIELKKERKTHSMICI